MPVTPARLETFAQRFVRDMTSIRGRRVVRILRREFAEFDVLVAGTCADGTPVALGLAANDVALLVTDGTGKEAPMLRGTLDPSRASEVRFDLLKDSLRVTGRGRMRAATVARLAGLRFAARAWVPSRRVSLRRWLEALA